MSKKVLFVCLGNICRSPSAEAVFRTEIKRLGLSHQHDSAGTSNWHVGEPPYDPMQKAAKSHGITMSDLRARQVTARDFQDFDVIVAMDRKNFNDLLAIKPCGKGAALVLMGDYLENDKEKGSDVPDPYYTRDFDATLDMLHRAMPQFIASL